MTATEELLSGLLADEAAAITRESLRPLRGPAAAGQTWRSRLYFSARRRLRSLAAVAAALSVLLVVGLAAAARSLIAAAPSFADIGTAMSPPPYYVLIDPNDNIVVQSTATGRRTDVVAPPSGIHANSFADAALAVSGDGRTFVAAYNDLDSLRTSLFRFSITSGGTVAGFSMIRTGHLPGLTGLSLAVSPDGSQVAVAGVADQSRSVQPSSGPPRLLVVNLTTGRFRSWGGLAGTGATDSIQDSNWLTGGTLRFLVARCGGSRGLFFNAGCEYAGPSGAVWTLHVPRGSAPLGTGRELVRLPGVTVQAQGGPAAGSVTVLQVLRGGGIRVARYAVPSGQLLEVMYRGKGDWNSNNFYAWLAVDGSGAYPLVNEDLGKFFGWIGGRRFHKLPIRAPYGNDEIVAAVW
jgi:hypothetical protein